jgi:predicted site-specific integrase-resolvase
VAAFDLTAACNNAGIPQTDRFTLPDVARILGVPAPVVRGWVKAGRLPCLAYSRRTRFVLASDLATFTASAYSHAGR